MGSTTSTSGSTSTNEGDVKAEVPLNLGAGGASIALTHSKEYPTPIQKSSPEGGGDTKK